MTFWKRQNCGDSKNFGGLWKLRGERDEKAESTEDF